MPNPTFKLISSVTVGAGGAASIDFTSIPSTYTDLVIKYSCRGDAATTDRGMFVRLNGDTGSNYTYKFVRGDGSSAGSGGTTTTFLYFGNFDAATSTANTFGNGEFYIPNYAGSTQKSVSSDSVSENNATSAWTTLAAGLWTGTAAINAITLYAESGNLVQFSSAQLYGIKNS